MINSVRDRSEGVVGTIADDKNVLSSSVSLFVFVSQIREEGKEGTRARYGFFFGFSTSSDDGVKCKRCFSEVVPKASSERSRMIKPATILSSSVLRSQKVLFSSFRSRVSESRCVRLFLLVAMMMKKKHQLFSDELNVIDTTVSLILSQTVDISSISTTDPSDSLFSLPSLQI